MAGAGPTAVIGAGDGASGPAAASTPRETLKRKRGSRSLLKNLSAEERRDRIASLDAETRGLLSYYREMMGQQELALDLGSAECGSTNGAIACCLEESASPLSKLVEEVCGKLKEGNAGGGGGLTVASVKSGVVFVGQRVMYGVPNADADILEDDSPSSLWCWETRELKLLPKSVHGLIKIRRTCRKKIHERLCAISAMVNALQKSEHDPDSELDLSKASEKLRKALNETELRLLVDSMLQKTRADMAEKGAIQDHKAYIKQLERNKQEVEKEKKRMDRELQKEKLKAEKELKRLQEEAEKEEKRCEKEELELKKQLKKQEEAKKDQRRREKEEAELKKQLALQKQASVMERFLKRSKTTSPVLDDKSTPGLPLSSKARECVHESIACLMDSSLFSDQEITIGQIWKSHLSSWHRLGLSIRSNQEQHWGIRRKPKTEIFKELKLTTPNSVKGAAQDDELNLEKIVSGWNERISDDASICKAGDKSHLGMRKCVRRKQLLQFDKSHRPAFYGIWPAKSETVGSRHPFRKDPELDYDVDSDEEWEEEDPGESLSDCDKDDEESLDEGCSKVDEDESEDEFFVPDGYLSENEGVHVDKMDTDISVEGTTSSSDQDSEHVVLSALLQQQKHLYNVTEQALRKNQPFIITNLFHEKSTKQMAGEVSAAQKLEQMCLEALSMLIFPGAKLPECLADNILNEDEEDCPANSKSLSTPAIHADVPDSELPTIVSTIQSCPRGINKVVDSLQQKLPDISKTLLRNKVREISDFVDNRWQVKREILDKLGLSVSPERSGGRAKSIASFLKRCLPPADGSVNADEIL
ncbi:chromatin assembly factor 1 subunit FAS1 [Syzygium oleosum]|uniref:chromatin assembly factor 1 subunit FAS1 n=1 Tax=Syzygium oleosum TaxID=219896 RepID=UPI0011D22062|nr:chromatin assembly factor 1 subunit FAS1 [Syzygium oleosum]